MYKSDSIFVRNKSVKCTEEFKSCVSQFCFVKSFQKMLAEHLLEKITFLLVLSHNSH